MNSIYEGIKIIDNIIKNAVSEEDAVIKLLNALKKQLKSNLIVINNKGKIMFKDLIGENSFIDAFSVNQDDFIEKNLNEQLLQLQEAQYNVSLKVLSLKNFSDLSKYIGMVIPIAAVSQRMGTLIVYREIGHYTRMDIIAIEYVLTMLALIIKAINNKIGEDNKRQQNMVKSAMDTLSYSELDAVVNIFTQLEGIEGMIVASRIADKAGITRSVIVNALRKLESAGLIESRSLGMKGTFIKVNNNYLIEEVAKLKG